MLKPEYAGAGGGTKAARMSFTPCSASAIVVVGTQGNKPSLYPCPSVGVPISVLGVPEYPITSCWMGSLLPPCAFNKPVLGDDTHT
jgi:hypothetical protein